MFHIIIIIIIITANLNKILLFYPPIRPLNGLFILIKKKRMNENKYTCMNIISICVSFDGSSATCIEINQMEVRWPNVVISWHSLPVQQKYSGIGGVGRGTVNR